MHIKKVLTLLKDQKEISELVFENDKYTFKIIKNRDSDKVLSVLVSLKKDPRDSISDYDNTIRIVTLSELKLFLTESIFKFN